LTPQSTCLLLCAVDSVVSVALLLLLLLGIVVFAVTTCPRSRIDSGLDASVVRKTALNAAVCFAIASKTKRCVTVNTQLCLRCSSYCKTDE
jgi:hypothetical protein